MVGQLDVGEVIEVTGEDTVRLHDAALREAAALGAATEDQAECAAGLVTAVVRVQVLDPSGRGDQETRPSQPA
ncbi:hypothetical protein [Nocardia sp. NRRL S-836]|uniref:hypothetical protein n=1 Tax=Nocardia sp. NRRL S-836 TaxID=1519492 RepID=UPI0006AF8BFD|nr:hypothetical protein [Nocardia sp. NRRL S-836]KOV84650.1 hypothetical protein ADL03_15285 [Nocardia sp. NRRL S-836]